MGGVNEWDHNWLGRWILVVSLSRCDWDKLNRKVVSAVDGLCIYMSGTMKVNNGVFSSLIRLGEGNNIIKKTL